MLMQVLQLCRKHEVTIDSSYASLVVAVCVLVGFAQSLDPELSIMDATIPCLPSNDVNLKVSISWTMNMCFCVILYMCVHGCLHS